MTLLSPDQMVQTGGTQVDMVIVHNAMPLWSLPGLADLRKRDEGKTRFWKFGVGKGEEGQSYRFYHISASASSPAEA